MPHGVALSVPVLAAPRTGSLDSARRAGDDRRTSSLSESRIMRAVVQRVSTASVSVGGTTVGAIDAGLMVLVCAMRGDTPAQAEKLARKIVALRIFRDDAGKMNRALRDTGGAVLAVSQFTLAADMSSGNRPGFSNSAPPDAAEALYDHFCDALRAQGIQVATGRFGAAMQVALVNDGPVTLWIDI